MNRWLTSLVAGALFGDSMLRPVYALTVLPAIETPAVQLVIPGLVIAAFAVSLAFAIASELRRLRRHYRGRVQLMATALNHTDHGISVIDPAGRMTFCNDGYLEIHRLSRAELRPNMPLQEIQALAAARGALPATGWPSDPAAESSPVVLDLVDGRTILGSFHRLPNGARVQTFADISEQRALTREVSSTKRFLESIIENIPSGVAVKNLSDGKYVMINRSTERFMQLPRATMIGKTAAEVFSPATAAAVDAMDKKALQVYPAELATETAFEQDGRERVVAACRVIICDSEQKPESLITLFDDITEKRELMQQIHDSKRFLELILDHIPIAVFVRSVANGKHLLVNRFGEKIIQRKRDAVVGHTIEEVFADDLGATTRQRDQTALREPERVIQNEFPVKTDDSMRLVRTRRVAVSAQPATPPDYIIQTIEDITAQRHAEGRMQHMLHHDGLTDLPNRLAFVRALEQMIEACDGADEFAVISMDLDRFKEVNDVFGHAIGDRLLVEASQRIQRIAAGAIVSRLGGDEFGLITDGVQPRAGVELAERLIEAMHDEFVIEGKAVRLGATAGLALFPRDGHDAAALLANANVALFRAKQAARGSLRVFESQMDQQIRDRRAMHLELSAALQKEQLCLNYQPVARPDGEVIGFEALVRWNHPSRGFVPPGVFIPLAEESGVIVEIGEWILREACREAASWEVPLQIAVNLSPVQFTHGDLAQLVHTILLETGLTPGRLELEITEGVLISDFERGLALLRRLKALGVRISMDDFGSGYSSLSYLQSFPFDKIKIDRAFIMNLGARPQSAAIVRAVIGLGHGLDIPIVAEGVETQEQLVFLANEQCDQVQGYLIGKPASVVQYAGVVRPSEPRADGPRQPGTPLSRAG